MILASFLAVVIFLAAAPGVFAGESCLAQVTVGGRWGALADVDQDGQDERLRARICVTDGGAASGFVRIKDPQDDTYIEMVPGTIAADNEGQFLALAGSLTSGGDSAQQNNEIGSIAVTVRPQGSGIEDELIWTVDEQHIYALNFNLAGHLVIGSTSF